MSTSRWRAVISMCSVALVLLVGTDGVRCESRELKEGTAVSVHGPSAGDRVRLRAEAAAASKSLAELAPDATGVVATGRSQMNGPDKWIEVRVGEKVGWVHSRYVRAAAEKDAKAERERKSAATQSTKPADKDLTQRRTPKPGTRLRVDGTSKGDKLNLRAEAGAASRVVAELQPSADNLIATGKSQQVGAATWIEVRVDKDVGWVNSRYVREIGATAKTAEKAPEEAKRPARTDEGKTRARAVSTDPVGDCDSSDTERRIAGCSELLELGEITPSARAVAYSRRSDSYIERKEFDRVIADRHEALRLAPDDPYQKGRLAAAYHLRGLKHTTAKDYDRALADYTKALSYDEKSHAALEARGLTHAQMAQLDKAIDDLSTAVEHDGRNERYRQELTDLYLRRSVQRSEKADIAGAINDCNEAMRISGPTVALYVLRADLHSAKKDWDQAGADIEIALELDPGNAHALLIRGTLWLESGSAALAAQALSELLKKDPKNTRALLLRATANEHLLDHDKAIADYRTVLKIDPRNAGATRSIKRIGAYQKSLKR